MNKNMNSTTKQLKLLFITVFSVFSFSVQAQEVPSKITLSVENQSIAVVLERIEEQTGLTFYFDANWFKTTTVTKTYTNKGIDEVLKDLLKETDLNYYKDANNNIFLTRNSFVYDSLPKDFFGEEDTPILLDTEEEALTAAPVFDDGRQARSTKRETVRIGKATADRSQRTVRLTGRVTDFFTEKPVPDNHSAYKKIA